MEQLCDNLAGDSEALKELKAWWHVEFLDSYLTAANAHNAKYKDFLEKEIARLEKKKRGNIFKRMWRRLFK